MKPTLTRRLVAEFIGTLLLLAAGIMTERLAGGNVALAPLANTVATGAALVALILAFGPCRGHTSIRPSRWQTRTLAESPCATSLPTCSQRWQGLTQGWPSLT
jgi:hypothetical protein